MQEFVKIKTTSRNRLNALFGLYDAKVLVSKTPYYYLVGAGSLNCLHIVKELTSNVTHKDKIATIGRYCDFNRNCRLILAGEHPDTSSVLFSGSPLLKYAVAKHGYILNTHAKAETVIGHQCIVASGAAIVSGSKIANHSLIAANALVSGKFSCSGILKGVPAKLHPLKRENLHDFYRYDPIDLFKGLQSKKTNINKLEVLTPKIDAIHRKQVVIEVRYSNGGLEQVSVCGLACNGEFVPLSKLSAITQKSIGQLALTSDEIDVDLNIFRDFN